MTKRMNDAERLIRLMSYAKPQGECLVWQASFIQNYKIKYGTTSYKSKHWLAHRLSYYLHTGDHPGKKQVMHSCDNGLCINPWHLRTGSAKENMREAGARKRMWRQTAAHCLHGHAFTIENTSYHKRSDAPTKMSRVCRKCKSNRSKKYRTILRKSK